MVQRKPSYRGCVDTLIDGVMSGWALDQRVPDKSIMVELYIDAERVASFRADRPRPDLAVVSPESQAKGFLADIRPFLSQDRFPRIDVRFGGSLERLTVTPEVSRQVNRPRIDFKQLALIGYSEFIPTPPPELMTYVSGRAGPPELLRGMHLSSGLHGAVDLYNLMLDVGLEPQRPDFQIIDVGSGPGRYAPFLAQFMPEARYVGVDIKTEAIVWAQNAFSPTLKGARFELLAESGKYAAGSSYRLPVANETADALMSMSLFTHLDRTAALGYLAEVRRVLAPEGAAMITCCLLDATREPFVEAKSVGAGLQKRDHAWWVGDEREYIDIYYRAEALEALASEADLEIVMIRLGNWANPEVPAVTPGAYQDMLVLRRRPA